VVSLHEYQNSEVYVVAFPKVLSTAQCQWSVDQCSKNVQSPCILCPNIFVVSQCHLVKSLDQIADPLTYSADKSFTASVPETSISSTNGMVFHTFNPSGSLPFSESATCKQCVTERTGWQGNFSAKWNIPITNLNLLSHPLYRLPCNESYLAQQVQIANSRTDSHS